MKIAFITNILAHYRVKTFETLARYEEVDYYFFGASDAWYEGQKQSGSAAGIPYVHLPGFQVAGKRIAPTLARDLWRKHYDVYLASISGRYVLLLTYMIARLKRRPVVLWTGVWQRLQTPAHQLFFPVTRLLMTSADAVVVYGDHVKRYLISEGVESSRIFVAAHAVDNSLYATEVSPNTLRDLRQKLEIDNDRHVILFLARLELEKGVEHLLDAFAKLPCNDAVLVMAGRGPAEDKVRAKARSLRVEDRVRFVGYVKPTDTVPYYALATVFVLPSITTRTFKEPWGLVVNEALNQGVPVIATGAVGAVAGGLIQHGENGLIVPERDSQALAEALHLILSQPALRAEMCREARASIQKWDNDRMVDGFRRAFYYAVRSSRTT